jgi:hypothetical protein
MPTVRLLGVLALSLAAGSVVSGGCRRDPAIIQLAEARRLTDDLRIQLAKVSDASDRAVMADTDEESVAFAQQAQQATTAVEADVAGLKSRLEGLGQADDLATLQEFIGHFADYRAQDRTVLALAVQNTNLKAQRLSFGPIRQAADAFCAALGVAAAGVSPKDRAKADALVARAQLAVREVQVLQAPHIAEANEVGMTELEHQMSERQKVARDALEALGPIVDGGHSSDRLGVANATLDRFDKLSAELVALSRRNSNVVSLSLALRKLPALTAACDASLSALQDRLSKQASTGTR